MNKLPENIYDLIENGIKVISHSVEDRSNELKLKLVVYSGITKTNNGRLGYITCFPHESASEDSLDGIIEITEFIDSIKVTIGVYWSNGTIVTEIGEIIFFTDYTESQLQELKDMMMELTDKIIRSLT